MNSLTNSSYVLDQVVHHGQAGPSAIALIHGATQISYGDLVSRVSQAAEALRAHRWEAGSTVMVALPRGPEQIITLLAAWAVGLTVVPVDPDDPTERQTAIRSATGAVATITLAGYEPTDEVRATRIKDHCTVPDEARATAPGAYAIFTSGSTGTPKGVLASHEAFADLIKHLVSRYAITRDDRVLQFAAPTFDTALEQIGVTLAAGATLVQPDTPWAPSEFADQLALYRVTVMDLTPSYWRAVAVHAASSVSHQDLSVRLAILGGAAVSNHDLIDVSTHYPRARIINAYGLTETGITSCLAEPDISSLPETGPAAVGAPIEGAHVVVIDDNHTPVPHGTIGHVGSRSAR